MAIKLSTITPGSGAGGDTVSIVGTGLSDAMDVVFADTTGATGRGENLDKISDTEIQVDVPHNLAVGSGKVHVEDTKHAKSNLLNFEIKG